MGREIVWSLNLDVMSASKCVSAALRLRHGETVFRVAQHTREPLGEIIDSRTVFEVLEQCLDRHAFDRRILAPIKHEVILVTRRLRATLADRPDLDCYFSPHYI